MTTFLDTTSTPAEFSHRYRDAYERLEAERAALSPAELLAVNLDVATAVTAVIGTFPFLASLRPEIQATYAKFDWKSFDNLESYAYALYYAQTVYLTASTPVATLPELAARAMKLRELFLPDAKALANRGMLDGRLLDEVKGGPGYRNTAMDLAVLVRMFRASWSTVSTKTAVTLHELGEAEQMVEQLTNAVGERLQAPVAVAAAADSRQRAFTLLVKAYEEARRVTTHLRWHQNDADRFVPSLYAGRGGRGKSTPAEGTPQPAPSPSVPVTHAAPIPPVEPGMPGGSPFAN